MKKGLSDVVTTVLIILLVLASIVIVWSFIRPTLKNAGEQIETDSLTSSLVVVSGSVVDTPSAQTIRFNVKRNQGGGDIVGFNVTLENSTGYSRTFGNYQNASLKEFEVKQVTLVYTGKGLGSIKKIILVPLIRSPQTSKVSSGKLPTTYTVPSGSTSSGNTTSPPPTPVCGNSIVETGEACDPPGFQLMCSDLSYTDDGNDFRLVTCTSSCTWNTSQCIGQQH
ncbi:hypothetical protein KW787_03920 [Candidatus Pacearchaeota archaeon]|nr:hypothetical protein [Candidatus Pacearchaeota archaeon]